MRRKLLHIVFIEQKIEDLRHGWANASISLNANARPSQDAIYESRGKRAG